MRYSGNCEQFCANGSDLSDDICVIAAHEKMEIENRIQELKTERWNFVTLSLDSEKKPIMQLSNGPEFEKSCKDESDKLKLLLKYVQMFNKLNQIFDEVAVKYPTLTAPTLEGLRSLKAEHLRKGVNFENRVKADLAYRMGLQSKGRTVDEVIKDPGFVAFKTEHEKYIAETKAKITELDFYISAVKKAVIMESE